MANKIVLKKSSVAAKVPLSTDLEVGELAVNLVDQKLYSKKTDGTVILVGSAAGGVDSVNGQTGIVVLDAADVGAVGTITSSDGSINVAATGSTVDITVSEASPASTLLGAVRNQTGATLTKGTVVYISGATGNKALVSKAIATSDATSAQTYGVITTDLANNANGFVTIVGALTNLNTSAFTEGVQLYLSATTAGAYTSTKQYAPNHLVYVGVVTRSHPTQGSIEVKIQNGYEMDELHNVSAQTPSNGNVLIWNATTQLWESAGISAGTGISVTNGAGSITVNNTGVTSVTGTAPVVSSGGTTPAISMAAATASVNGYLTSTDWNTFNNKTSNLGTVTSVGGTGTVNGITLTGTVTTSGNLTLGGTLSGVSLTTQVSGTLPLANGGTNATTAADARTNLDVPTRTGTNASGTWGISVTGNAATATSADNIDGIAFKNSTSTSSFVVDTQGTNGIGYSTGYTLFGQTDGGVYCATYSADWQHQINGDFRTGQIAIRGKNAGTWQAWRVVLDSSNYNSYSPTLTGGGASGSWGINITGSSASCTGNAATATASQNVTFLTQPNASWGGRMQLGGNGGGSGVATIAVVQATDGNLHIDNGSGKAMYLGYYHPGTIYLNGGTYNISSNGANYNGTAANTSSISSAVGGSYAWTNSNYFKSNQNTSGSNAPLQAFSDNGGGAIMSFHRGGAFAVNFGLDSDNVMRIGGWSAPPNLWQLDMSGNNTLNGGLVLNGSLSNRYVAPSGTFPVVIGNASGFPVDRGIILQSSSGSSIPLYFTVSSGATVSGSVIASGGSTAYNTSSDYRMKENIRDLDVLAAVNKIMSIRPRVFDWKEECGGKKNSVGFIAHELQEYAPECVNGEKDQVHSDGAIFPQGVDSSWLIPSISAMLQEHQKVIEQLKAEIALLKGI
jgi:hypothetical protein